MKNLESAYKKLPVKMNAFFINEYVHVKYIKIKEGLNCFLSLRSVIQYRDSFEVDVVFFNLVTVLDLVDTILSSLLHRTPDAKKIGNKLLSFDSLVKNFLFNNHFNPNFMRNLIFNSKVLICIIYLDFFFKYSLNF